MSVRLIFVRHGETDWNKASRLQGRIEIPLNKNGIKQIKKTAVKLKKSSEKPEIIISSPLTRAVQSAGIISKILAIPFQVNRNLAERDFGSLEGKTWEEINKIYGSDFKEIDRKQQYDYRVYGGESADEVSERIIDFLDYAIKKYDGKTIVVITHAGILRSLSLFLHRVRMDLSCEIKPGEFCIIEL